MTKKPTAVDLLSRSFDRFKAKDMRGWVDLCAPMLLQNFLLRQPDHRTGSKGVMRSMNI